MDEIVTLYTKENFLNATYEKKALKIAINKGGW